MKMVNNTENGCSTGDDMLAYLFDELSAEGRERFETHLEGCGLCVDEFAELSVARYSVYEWKNLEFARLATPRFVVPSEQPHVRLSWLDSIKAVFGWNGIPALASGVAVLIIGVFAFVIWVKSPEGSVATAVEQAPPAKTESSTVVPRTNAVEPADVDETALDDPEVTTSARRGMVRDTLAVRNQTHAAKTKPVSNAKVMAVQSRRTTANRRLDNSPTLGLYVEDRDETLRLSDLFDNLGTRELD